MFRVERFGHGFTLYVGDRIIGEVVGGTFTTLRTSKHVFGIVRYGDLRRAKMAHAAAWGLDADAVQWMETHGVQQTVIHFSSPPKKTYTCTLSTWREKGSLDRFGDYGLQYFLTFDRFTVRSQPTGVIVDPWKS